MLKMRIVRMLKIIVKVIGIGNDSIENDGIESDNKSDSKNDGIENSVLKIVY